MGRREGRSIRGRPFSLRPAPQAAHLDRLLEVPRHAHRQLAFLPGDAQRGAHVGLDCHERGEALGPRRVVGHADRHEPGEAEVGALGRRMARGKRGAGVRRNEPHQLSGGLSSPGQGERGAVGGKQRTLPAWRRAWPGRPPRRAPRQTCSPPRSCSPGQIRGCGEKVRGGQWGAGAHMRVQPARGGKRRGPGREPSASGARPWSQPVTKGRKEKLGIETL